MGLEAWQRYTPSKPCPICKQECKGWLHKDQEHAFCSRVESSRMTDMHSLTVFKHPLQISLLDYEAGAKILDRFKKGHTKGTALIAEHGFTLDDAQRKAYKEAMGRAWDKPFDPQFNYSGQRSKADKAIFKNLKE